MTIFDEDAWQDTPILTEWMIVGGLREGPRLIGRHAFHEGARVAVTEIVVLDPMLRWAITPYGGYRLAGGGTLAEYHAKFGVEKRDH